MRCSLALSAVAAVFIATTNHSVNAFETAKSTLEVLDYSIESQDISFILKLGAAQSSHLLFELETAEHKPTDGCLKALDVLIDGRPAGLCFQSHEVDVAGAARPTRVITAQSDLSHEFVDVDGGYHTLNFTVHGYALNGPWQLWNGNSPIVGSDIGIRLTIDSIDDSTLPPDTGFVAHYNLGYLETLKALPEGDEVDVAAYEKSFQAPRHWRSWMRYDRDMNEIDEELATLRLLEQEAELLSAEIAARQKAIRRRIKLQTSKVPLSQLIAQCDNLICVAKVTAQRICAKASIGDEAPPAYTQIHPHTQSVMAASGDDFKPLQVSRNCTKEYGTLRESPEKSKAEADHATILEPTVTRNGTTAGGLSFIGQSTPQSHLVIALEAIASILGLVALYAFIRRKCMSARSRVERAADREERRTARAYRRAARRAMYRRKWRSFIDSINCFGGSDQPPRTEDYEEKRALILQDALLEQGMDQAEKGEIMEAEIRELRNAHEIVAGLVGARAGPYAGRWRTDPPPSLVPLPLPSRSRASTATLPSYTSEDLPDYTSDYSSTPGLTEGSDTVTDGFVNYTPTGSDEDGRYRSRAPTSSAGTASTSRSRYTPVSSVLGLSPRASAETLRTRQSKDSRE